MDADRPTPEQLAEWGRLYIGLASKDRLQSPSDRMVATLELAAATGPLLTELARVTEELAEERRRNAALAAADDEAAQWKIEAGKQSIARSDAERHRDLLAAALEGR